MYAPGDKKDGRVEGTRTETAGSEIDELSGAHNTPSSQPEPRVTSGKFLTSRRGKQRGIAEPKFKAEGKGGASALISEGI